MNRFLTTITLAFAVALATVTIQAFATNTPGCVAVWYEDANSTTGVTPVYVDRSRIAELPIDKPFVGVMIYLKGFGSGVNRNWFSGVGERLGMRYNPGTNELTVTWLNASPKTAQRKTLPGNLDDIEISDLPTNSFFDLNLGGHQVVLTSADWSDKNYTAWQDAAFFGDPGTCRQ